MPFVTSLFLILIAIAGAALALAAFVWAVRNRQFSMEHLERGALVIFDEDEPVGLPQDLVFKKSDERGRSR